MQLGIDIGGTYLRYELRDDTNHSVAKGVLESSSIELSAFVAQMIEQESAIEYVFIAFAGQVYDGKVIAAPHIQVKEQNIKAYIEKHYEGVTLFIENDLSCAVLAEAAFYKSRDLVALYVGTGLGMGVVSDGRVLKGSSHIAAEIGHIPYKKAPFVCSCGKSNCIELFASGSALIRIKAYKNLDPSLQLQDLRKSSVVKEREIYEEFMEGLLHAAAIAITLCNPKVLVLGGGIVANDAEIYADVQKDIKDYAMPLSLQNVEIVRSQLDDASLEGAFLLKDSYVR
jgi:glucokinase